MNNDTVQSSRSSQLLMALMFFSISLICGLYLMEKMLDPQTADKRLLQLSKQANQLYCLLPVDSDLCLLGTGAINAPATVVVKNHPVFGSMQWLGGSEADAAAFMARAKTLSMLHFEKNHKYLREDIEELIAPVWHDYPIIVSASACLYCGDITNAVLKFIQEYELLPEWVETVAKGISRYLPHLAKSGALSDDEFYRLARIQAQLGHAGDSRVAKAIAEPLVRNNDMKNLSMWVANGLNGGRSVTDSEVLQKLPLEVIILAWRHGVAGGYDTIELTEFLLQSGYRPALRWLVWLQDGSATYLTNKSSSYRYNEHRYEELLKSHTDFPSSKGREVGSFYSNNWQSIYWDEQTKVWRH